MQGACHFVHSVPKRFVPKNVGHWHSLTHRLPRHGACPQTFCPEKCWPLALSHHITKQGAYLFVHSVPKHFVPKNVGHWHCLTQRLPRHGACHFVHRSPTVLSQKMSAIGTLLPRHGACQFVRSVLVPKNLSHWNRHTHRQPRHGACQFVHSVPKRFVLKNLGHWHCHII
jgi:hypothetical protein